MALIVGPPGPTAVHTPEICYSSRAFEIAEPRTKSSFKPTAESSHSLWKSTFRSRNAGSGKLSVHYGWSLGDQWTASESPRFEFGGHSLLYKIQVAAQIDADVDDESIDPGQEFVNAFLRSFWKTTDASLRNH
jgi:hypothetical protein